jgi:hypothetical protein
LATVVKLKPKVKVRSEAKAAPKLRQYRRYRFNGQLPLIADVLKAVGDNFRHIEEEGGATRTTLKRWADKKVRCPTTYAIEASLRVAGKKLAIIDDDE